MKILRWLFKTPRDHSTHSRSQRKSEDEVKPRDLVIYDRGGGYQSSKEVSEKEEEVEEENKSTFTILPRRQGSGTRFYSTLHLEHLRSLSSNQNFWYPEKSESRMGHKADSASVGCKVLPICDAVSTSSNGGDSSDGSDKDVHKGERRRAVSQMKELLKWAAAAKSHKGGRKGWKVSYFRNRVRHPLVEGGCSTSSCMDSSLSMASSSRNDQMLLVKNSSNLSGNLRSSESDVNMLARPKSEEYAMTGRWITTDSDFVVLEL